MKECFGKYKSTIALALTCDTCEDMKKCHNSKNAAGDCVCPYKLSCHTSRQKGQASSQIPIERCFFYKALKPVYDMGKITTWPINMEQS